MPPNKPELTATEPTTAFLFVKDRQGNNILDFETVWGIKTRFKKGETKTVGSAFKLSIPNQGESLQVLYCKESLEEDQLREAAQMWFEKSNKTALPEACGAKSIKLRE